jgi:glutamate/aspartate transport system substrate-binding protein
MARPSALMNFLRPIVVAVVALSLAGPAAAASPTLDRIKASGKVTFGYRDNAAPFSVRQRDGRVRGYSVEICEKIAAAIGARLGLPGLAVEWRAVDNETRIGDVVAGKIDAECGTTTITLARRELVDFSLPIFVDGGSALAHTKHKLATVADLAGSRVAVIFGTTTEKALRREFAVLGIKAELVPVRDGPEGMAAIRSGKAHAYASDRMLLAQLKDIDPAGAELEFLRNDFSYEPYALTLPRGDADFRLLVDRTLAALYKSGDIDPIFIRWLAPYGNPGPLLNAMFYLNTLPD